MPSKQKLAFFASRLNENGEEQLLQPSSARSCTRSSNTSLYLSCLSSNAVPPNTPRNSPAKLSEEKMKTAKTDSSSWSGTSISDDDCLKGINFDIDTDSLSGLTSKASSNQKSKGTPDPSLSSSNQVESIESIKYKLIMSQKTLEELKRSFYDSSEKTNAEPKKKMFAYEQLKQRGQGDERKQDFKEYLLASTTKILKSSSSYGGTIDDNDVGDAIKVEKKCVSLQNLQSDCRSLTQIKTPRTFRIESTETNLEMLQNKSMSEIRSCKKPNSFGSTCNLTSKGSLSSKISASVSIASSNEHLKITSVELQNTDNDNDDDDDDDDENDDDENDVTECGSLGNFSDIIDGLDFCSQCDDSPQFNTYSVPRNIKQIKDSDYDDIPFKNWLSGKVKANILKHAKLRRDQEQARAEQERKVQMAKEQYEIWLQRKSQLQLQKSNENVELPAVKGKTTKKLINEEEAKRKVEEWKKRKIKEAEEKRLKQKMQEEQKHYETERKKKAAEEAYQKWKVKAANKPRPVPLNQGLLTLRGTVSKLFVNENEWKN